MHEQNCCFADFEGARAAQVDYCLFQVISDFQANFPKTIVNDILQE